MKRSTRLSGAPGPPPRSPIRPRGFGFDDEAFNLCTHPSPFSLLAGRRQPLAPIWTPSGGPHWSMSTHIVGGWWGENASGRPQLRLFCGWLSGPQQCLNGSPLSSPRRKNFFFPGKGLPQSGVNFAPHRRALSEERSAFAGSSARKVSVPRLAYAFEAAKSASSRGVPVRDGWQRARRVFSTVRTGPR